MNYRRPFFYALLLVPSLLRAEIDHLKAAAQELANGISRHKNVRVAVLAMPYYDNHASEGPVYISDKLETYLVMDERIRVLNRNHVIQLLQEQRLSETGAMDAQSAKRIGRLLGADVIVTGTMIDLDRNKTEINVRGIFPESGRVIAASRALVERTWQSKPSLHTTRASETILDWNR